MVGRPRRLPNGGARDLEPDGDVGELCADRLMLDDAAPALHAQLRVVERRLVGGAPDAEIERRILRDAAARARSERMRPRGRAYFRPAPGNPGASAAARAVMPARVRVARLHASSRAYRAARAACRRRFAEVVTATANSPASGALTTRSLRPLMIQSSPERTAVVVKRASLGCRAGDS